MDEIFFAVRGVGGRVSIVKRCYNKSCLALHHMTFVDDDVEAKIIVDALNSSKYASDTSKKLNSDTVKDELLP